MKAGKITPGSVGAIKYNTWVKAYETTLLTSASSVTISGLLGDTDKEYKLEARIAYGSSSAGYALVRLNNDSGTNYGQQTIDGGGTDITAFRSTSNDAFYLNDTGNSENYIIYGNMTISAKSGYPRTCVNENAWNITGTTVYSAEFTGQVWNNTADELTSLVIVASKSGGLGTGSYITLWKRSYK